MKVSERTFESYLDRLRLEVFDKYTDEFLEQGITPTSSPEEYRALARFVNIASGRGELGRLNKYSRALDAAFFSPRLAASRFQILNPVMYLSMPPAARKIAMRKMVQFAGTLGTTLLMAKLAGADVSLDPMKGAFGKVSFGKTHIDVSGGNAYTVRFLVRFARSAWADLGPEDRRGRRIRRRLGGREDASPFALAARFLRSKLSPAGSLVADYATGKTMEGEEFTWKGAVGERVVPLFVQDLTDALEQEGWRGLVHAAPSGLGFSVNTYGTRGRRTSEWSPWPTLFGGPGLMPPPGPSPSPSPPENLQDLRGVEEYQRRLEGRKPQPKPGQRVRL